MKIVALTVRSAEVHLGTKIGNVASSGQRWWWQHRDGEQSSPVAESRGEAADALVNYHLSFKQVAQETTGQRRLLFV